MAHCDTPVTYNALEARHISRAVVAGDPRPLCPRCGHELEVGPEVLFGARPVREYVCPDCQRCIVIRGRSVG